MQFYQLCGVSTFGTEKNKLIKYIFMTNKILAKWAHFIKHGISTIVTKTSKNGPYDGRKYQR